MTAPADGPHSGPPTAREPVRLGEVPETLPRTRVPPQRRLTLDGARAPGDAVICDPSQSMLVARIDVPPPSGSGPGACVGASGRPNGPRLRSA